MVAVDPSQFSLDFITQHIYNDKAKKDGIPRNWGNWGSICVRKYKKWLQMLQLPRKMKSICQTTAISIQGTQEAFSDKLTPDTDAFTDERMWCLSFQKLFCTWLQMNNKVIMIPNKF